jgi:hypothetical protein
MIEATFHVFIDRNESSIKMMMINDKIEFEIETKRNHLMKHDHRELNHRMMREI